MIECPVCIREITMVEFSATIVSIFSDCKSNISLNRFGLRSLDVRSIVKPSLSSRAAEVMHSPSTNSVITIFPTTTLKPWHLNTIWIKFGRALHIQYLHCNTHLVLRQSPNLFFCRIQLQIHYLL